MSIDFNDASPKIPTDRGEDKGDICMDATTTELYTIENGTRTLTEYVIASINKHRYEVKDEDEVLYEGESFQHAKSIYEQPCRKVIRSEEIPEEIPKPKPANDTLDAYQGYEIRSKDGGFVNLTSAWKATGAVESKAPKYWLRQDNVVELIEIVAKKLNVRISDITITERGRYGGTFAHWQIFLAYARDLGPEFSVWAKQMVQERFGELIPE